MPVVIATVWPRPEHRDEVLAALRAAVPEVHAEEGCELYALHEAEDRFVFVERWISVDALAKHADGPVIAEVNSQVDGLVAKPADIVIVEPVPLGDPRKGHVAP